MKLLDDAQRWVKQAIERKPDYAEAHYWLGLVLGVRGDFFAAVRAYEETVRIEPGHARAHSMLGRSHLSVLSYKEARDHLERALSLNPGDEESSRLLPKAEREIRKRK
jgi:tetratricopeptide (TPR) repeat protein